MTGPHPHHTGTGTGTGTGAAELAALIHANPRPPMLTAHNVVPDGDTQAALLVWGRHRPTRSWHAGVAFLYTGFRGGPLRALVTIWLPATQVSRRRHETYTHVPRVLLTGQRVEQWPPLPPVYPGAPPDWIAAHHHATHIDPQRRYGIRPTPARRNHPTSST